ncbi:unnamed protein product [Parajaminaea phylloscopi]
MQRRSSSRSKGARSTVLALACLCLCLAFSCVAATTPGRSPAALYDPADEGFLQRATRNLQKRFMGSTDEDITEIRRMTAASLAPTFNSHALTIDGYNGSTVAQLFNMPPPPLVERSDAFPWQSLGRQEDSAWVVLLTAPSGDPTSRGFNAIFNDTLNLVFPPSDDSLAASLAKLVSTPFENDASRAEDDETARLALARRQRVEESSKQAKSYRFAVADYEYSPDLAWAWWVWKVPVIVFVTPSTSPDRLYDLRFWKVAFVSGLTPEYVVTYIASGSWKADLKVWSGSLAPGGSRSWIPPALAAPSNLVYDNFSRVPTWVIGIVSTMLGGTLISFMHGSKPAAGAEGRKGSEKERGQSQAKVAASAQASGVTTGRSGSSSTVERKS